MQKIKQNIRNFLGRTGVQGDAIAGGNTEQASTPTTGGTSHLAANEVQVTRSASANEISLGGSSKEPGESKLKSKSGTAASAASAPPSADPRDNVPSMYCCPICFEVMSDPVVLATGHTYDRECIRRWISNGHKTCPTTGARLRHLELMPNFALRNAVREWATNNNYELRPVSEQACVTALAEPSHVCVQDVSENMPGQQILQGHDEIVWAMEMSGRRLFSASADKTIRVWDTQALRCLHVLEEHTRPVLSLAVTSTHLFSGSYDCTIRAWSLATFARVAVLEGHSDAVRALTVAGGRLFSGSYDNTVRVWDVDPMQDGPSRSKKCVKVLEAHTGPVRTLASAGGRVFSGSYDRTVCVWDVQLLQKVGKLEGHTEAVRALAAGGRFVFSGSDDTSVRVWDAHSLECLRVLRGHQDNVRVLAVGRGFLYSGSWDKTIHVWNLHTLALHQVLHGHTEAVLALTVARGHLVSGSYDMSVQFWDLNTLRCVRKCEGHLDAVRVLTSTGEFSEQVFSGSYDGSIGCWKPPSNITSSR
mmetsp:Transcript_26651/g.50639  ORF Transcript_26651/g.50639 Transcript_26651/m.50639 type:complete len:532 (+) Transcript_26651:449-2044(+)|eukprot:CAMPEP_0114248132 /NCGR_PEP_ID=MMETSP0058-20121206/13403_1 /TAXON_ID=36894 /ORGANISM="Pyramimonas parkeae, CCMP726" /LENGTH=531 /DNA_ID=CAMNT_0001361505 /DNA_START=449 /DNA_END=2044 /DNA_ORIENTATION=-